MKLAILVTYMFDSGLAPMVRVHLDRIRRHTASDYKIYAAAPELNADELRFLESDPAIEIVDVLPLPPHDPNSPIGATQHEHDAKLSALRKQAALDGATHFVCLHQDSFPIRDRWDEGLAARLEEGAGFVTVIPFSYNAGLFWGRSWEEKNVPFLVPVQERETQDFLDFQAAHPDLDTQDGGLGFLFRAWQEGTRYIGLEPTGPNIWGRTFFHLVGATRLTHSEKIPTYVPASFRGSIRLVERMLPPQLARQARRLAKRLLSRPENVMGRAGTPLAKKRQIAALVNDPDKFISACLQNTLETTYAGQLDVASLVAPVRSEAEK